MRLQVVGESKRKEVKTVWLSEMKSTNEQVAVVNAQ